MSDPHGSRSRQLHYHKPHGAQSDPKSSRQRQLARQAKGRRMRRRIPRKSNRGMIFSPDSPGFALAGYPQDHLSVRVPGAEHSPEKGVNLDTNNLTGKVPIT